MVKIGKGIFHPVASSSWPEFLAGSVLAGVLLGIGWAIGSNIVNHFAPSWLRAPPVYLPEHGEIESEMGK